MQDESKTRESRTKWAEDRTDWAEDRTVLANERTFAGWMRTGLASVAVALGLHAVFRAFEPVWAAKAVATVFILAAVFTFWTAWRNARRTDGRMKAHEVDSQSGLGLTLLTVMLTLGAVGAGAVLWLL